MFSAVSTIIVIFTLLLGGAGATVAAANQSMPDDGLYRVKTWSEQVRVQLTEREQSRLRLALELANRRAEEIQYMLRSGQVPEPSFQVRLRAEIDRALELAAGQPQQASTQSLEQIRLQLRLQEQAFAQVVSRVGSEGEAYLAQTRTMLQSRLQICEEGIKDPSVLGERLRNRDRSQQSNPETVPTEKPAETQPASPVPTERLDQPGGYGPGPGDGQGDSAGDKNPQNPWVEETPQPGSGYGPGPGDGSGDCSGCDGENNPWVEEEPTPGSGYGPGPQPEPEEPGSGDSSGSGNGGTGANGDEPGSGPGDGSGNPENGGADDGGAGGGADSGGGSGQPGGKGGGK